MRSLIEFQPANLSTTLLTPLQPLAELDETKTCSEENRRKPKLNEVQNATPFPTNLVKR